MKGKTLVLALMLMMSITSVFANDADNVNKAVISNFNKEFVNAKDVKWTTNESFTKVSFSLNSQVFYAYYTEEGERIALSRHIPIASLPLNLSAELHESFTNYWITDAFEIVTKEESAYYVTIENADYKVTLKTTGLDSWSTYKKTVKN